MKFKLLALALIVFLLLTATLHSINSRVTVAPDFPTVSNVNKMEEIVIEIPVGATGSQVASLLFNSGIVKSSAAFFRVAVGDKKSERISPGAHRLTVGISAKQALEQLLDPTRIPNLLKIFEGAWKSEVIEMLRANGFSQTEIDGAFKDATLPKGFTSAEGLLFPAQYSFARGTTALEAVQAMINRFTSEKSGQDLLVATSRYTPLELLTIASIVQAEGDTKDFANVARVVFNRLKIPMPLQMDSTVHYIKKVRGQIFLSTSSTLINSPYNTYKNIGLPPTPIGNPGADAMRAVLNPSVGDWLFFITVAPGDTRFTSSSSEFLSWKRLYEKNRKAGAFE